VHTDDGAGLGARLEERVPVTVGIVNRREAEERRNLRERDRVTAPRRVAPDLLAGEL
jgi:hypothetical protein